MARKMIDYGRDADNNYLVVAGDFVRAECTAKHQVDLLKHDKGDYKQNPTVGVGVMSYVDDDNIGDLVRDTTVQFMGDGMEVKGIVLGSDGVIRSDAYYK